MSQQQVAPGAGRRGLCLICTRILQRDVQHPRQNRHRLQFMDAHQTGIFQQSDCQPGRILFTDFGILEAAIPRQLKVLKKNLNSSVALTIFFPQISALNRQLNHRALFQSVNPKQQS